MDATKDAPHASANGRRWPTSLVAGVFVLGVVAGVAGTLAWRGAEVSGGDVVSDASPSVTRAAAETETISYDPSVTTIEYEIVTDGMSVTHLSWVDVVDGEPEMQEKLGTPPPFEHVIQLPKDEPFDLTALSVTGMGAATSTTTTCTLRIDGTVVARQTADGTYGVVSCAMPAE